MLDFSQPPGLLETMNHHREQLALLMRHTEDGIWCVDPALQTVDINPIACNLLGWQADEVQGQSCLALCSQLEGTGHQILGEYFKQVLQSRQEVAFKQGLSLTLADARVVLIEGAIYPLLDQDVLCGAIAIFRPISADRTAEQVQANFIALASHNLRTPLMSIQATLDYILTVKDDEAKNQQRLTEARVQSLKIASFLRDLMDISHVTGQREIPLKIAAINFEALLMTVLDDMKRTTGEFACHLELAQALPLAATDELKTMVVLQSLISHGLRRNQQGADLTIRVANDETRLLISVIDQGPPIPVEHHQQLLWQIYPLEGSKQHEMMPYGYGLGLFSVRRLVELLGGTMWVSDSKAVKARKKGGQGISINFTLPIWRS